MEFVNRTGFPALAFRQLDRQGGPDAVVSARATLMIVPNGAMTQAAEQEPFQWEDVFEGDPDAVPLMRPNDLVPFKPGTDVTVLADAHCPDPDGAPFWPVGLRIVAASGNALLDKQLRVTGPRHWHPRLRPQWRALLGAEREPSVVGWELGAPVPAHRVPLDWRLARGGPLPDGPQPALHLGNPVGCGIPGRGRAGGRSLPAPQIEAAGAPIDDWQADPAPAGLGPVSPLWEWRTRHAGSGELVWLDARRAVLPDDFDERYWQCAPPDQVLIPWLRGTERFELLNLHPDHALLSGTLPGIMLGIAVERPGAATARLAMNLDGVHFDLRDDWERVVLTWRVRLPLPERRGVRLTLTERVRLAETSNGSRA